MMTDSIIVTGIFSQLYARLTIAAVNKVFVYYSDVSPTVYGLPFSHLNASQYLAVWELIRRTMQLDISQGRLPLAALYVSRATDSKMPKDAFFREYTRLTGKTLTPTEWEQMVRDIWRQYEMPEESRGI